MKPLRKWFMTTESQMIARAKQKVMNGTPWYTAPELAALSGVTLTDLEVQLRLWKEKKDILSVVHERVELFPAYAFADKLQPFAELKAILMLFDAKKNYWGTAYWFAGANGYLDGQRPQNVLQPDPDRVLPAAEDELAGVTHS
jgi:hypothetical protein